MLTLKYTHKIYGHCLSYMIGNLNYLNRTTSLKVFMEYGVGNNKRRINVTQLVILGLSICKSLPGFHALTGCYHNPSLYKKGKIRPFELVKNKVEYQETLSALAESHIIV